MARNEFPDDGTSAADDTYTYDDTINDSVVRQKKGSPILRKLFASCEDDALGSVHRAWAVTVLFMVLFFVVSIIEGEFKVGKGEKRIVRYILLLRLLVHMSVLSADKTVKRC